MKHGENKKIQAVSSVTHSSLKMFPKVSHGLVAINNLNKGGISFTLLTFYYQKY